MAKKPRGDEDSVLTCCCVKYSLTPWVVLDTLRVNHGLLQTLASDKPRE